VDRSLRRRPQDGPHRCRRLVPDRFRQARRSKARVRRARRC
jgi:hypothetical protein